MTFTSTSYQNQKIIHINKPTKYTEMYLSIGNSEWVEASKKLSYNTFKVYLYLASNAPNYDLVLSRQAVKNQLGMSKDSYLRAIKDLENEKYIVPKKGNVYDFYTVPMVASMQPSNEGVVASTHTRCMHGSIQSGSIDATRVVAPMHTEISNTSNDIYKHLSREAGASREEEREIINKDKNKMSLEEELYIFLTIEQLKSLIERFKKGRYDRVNHGYKILKKDFDLKNDLSIESGKVIESVLERKSKEKVQREQEEREQAANEALDYLGLNKDETMELLGLISRFSSNCSFSEVGYQLLDLYKEEFEVMEKHHMSGYDMLAYFQSNPLATKKTYTDYLTYDWTNSYLELNGVRYNSYAAYLDYCLSNTPEVIKSALADKEEEMKRKEAEREQKKKEAELQKKINKFIIKDSSQKSIFDAWHKTDYEIMQMVHEDLANNPDFDVYDIKFGENKYNEGEIMISMETICEYFSLVKSGVITSIQTEVDLVS